MKKRLLLLLLLLIPALLLLTGCLQVNIDFGINAAHTAYLSYSIDFDLSDTDPQYHDIVSRALNDFGWHYQENLGFTVGISTTSDVYRLTMKKSVSNDSFAEAFESLKTMLTTEAITPFLQVDMTLFELPRQDSYVLSALLDIPHIMELSYVDDLPPELISAIDNIAQTSSGVITASIPASEVHSSTHDVNIEYNAAVMSVPISFDSQTPLELRANIIYSRAGTQTETSSETVEALNKTAQLVTIVCAASLALLLIILLAVLIKIRKYNRLFNVSKR